MLRNYIRMTESSTRFPTWFFWNKKKKKARRKEKKKMGNNFLLSPYLFLHELLFLLLLLLLLGGWSWLGLKKAGQKSLFGFNASSIILLCKFCYDSDLKLTVLYFVVFAEDHDCFASSRGETPAALWGQVPSCCGVINFILQFFGFHLGFLFHCHLLVLWIFSSCF